MSDNLEICRPCEYFGGEDTLRGGTLHCRARGPDPNCAHHRVALAAMTAISGCPLNKWPIDSAVSSALCTHRQEVTGRKWALCQIGYKQHPTMLSCVQCDRRQPC